MMKPYIAGVSALLALVACSAPEDCPSYEVRAAGEVNGKSLMTIRIPTKDSKADDMITEFDVQAIHSTKICPKGFQDVSIGFDPLSADGQSYRNITFFCL